MQGVSYTLNKIARRF